MKRSAIYVSLTVFMVILFAASAFAGTLIFNLDTYMGGNEFLQGGLKYSPPWVEVKFEDIVSNQVRLTLTNLGLWYTGTAEHLGREHLGYFYFNVADQFVSNLAFTNLATNTEGQALDKFDTPGSEGGPSGPIQFLTDVKFDVRIYFDADYFPKNNPYSIVITSPGLSASSFNLLDKSGKWYAAAWVEDIDIYEPPPKDLWVNKSAAIGAGVTAVPEPATMFLLGSGLIGLAGFARRKFRK